MSATPTTKSKIVAFNDEYKTTTLPTLRAWLRYWEGVKATTRKLNDCDKDTDVTREIRKLSVEIGRRTA